MRSVSGWFLSFHKPNNMHPKKIRVSLQIFLKLNNGMIFNFHRSTNYENVYGIVSLIIGCFGILLACFVSVVYFCHRDTAIVKASGLVRNALRDENFLMPTNCFQQELSAVVIIGSIVTFSNPFAVMSKATVYSCTVSITILALGPTFMYAGLLIKTIRVVIIFKSRKMLSPQVKHIYKSGLTVS